MCACLPTSREGEGEGNGKRSCSRRTGIPLPAKAGSLLPVISMVESTYTPPLLAVALGERYHSITTLQHSTSATVVQAYDRQENRMVALKRFLTPGGKQWQFLQELSAIIVLNHPHIVRCFEFYQLTDSSSVLTLELADGGNLRHRPVTDGLWTPAQVLPVLIHVARGLAYVHAQGIVHRALKPANILCFGSGEEDITYKITDCGLAKFLDMSSESTTRIDALAYMAPEQLRDQYEAKTDIYALGVILYELLHGFPPFQGNPAEIFQAHLRGTAILAEHVPDDLAQLLRAMLAKQVGDRPNAQQLLQHAEALAHAYQLSIPGICDGVSMPVAVASTPPAPAEGDTTQVAAAVPPPGEARQEGTCLASGQHAARSAAAAPSSAIPPQTPVPMSQEVGEAASHAYGLPAVLPSLALTDLAGLEIERFRLETLLSHDTHRGTFAARHTRLNFPVIVRAVNLDAAVPDPALLDTLLQHAHNATRLSHANVVRALACTTHRNFLLIVTEFAEGHTLADRLHQEQTLPEEEALILIQAAAEGLHAGWQRGLLHGGICPLHIRMTKNRKIKVADYCWHIPQALLGQSHAPTSVPGQGASAAYTAPMYRAPEYLADASTADHRADIYALGTTLYHLVTGRRLVTGSNAERLTRLPKPSALSASQESSTSLSPTMMALLRAMTATQREQRVPTYDALFSQVAAAIRGVRLQQARTYIRDTNQWLPSSRV